MQRQNQELLRALDDLRSRQEELVRLNRELEDTNRGVVALYAELDERADHLRRADEIKTRFLSNMTHEFRTPVNSILALTNLLAERLGADPEEKDELFFIRKSAQQLSDLVDDLLDLAKVEAGKIEVRPASFEVGALFGALRGMLRPLLVNQSLALVFDEPEGIPPIYSGREQAVADPAQLHLQRAQVHRTRRGAGQRPADAGARRRWNSRSPTPASASPRRTCRGFSTSSCRSRTRCSAASRAPGSGCRCRSGWRSCWAAASRSSAPTAVGSTFTVIVPLIFRDPHADAAAPPAVDPTRLPVLVVEDSDEDLLLVQRALAGTRYQILHARTAATAESIVSSVKVAAIVLDIRLHGSEAWDLLARFKRDPAQSSRPVIVVSTVDDQRKGFALGADAYCVKPIDPAGFVRTLDRLVVTREAVRVLTVDDEEASRFIIRQLLNDSDHELVEASSGLDGLAKAHAAPPDVILLDLRLTDMTGFDVFARLRQDPATAARAGGGGDVAAAVRRRPASGWRPRRPCCRSRR